MTAAFAVRWKENDNGEFWPTPGQLELDVEHVKAQLEWQMHTRARLPERRAQRKPCNSVDVRADRADGLQTPVEDRSSPRSMQSDLAEIWLSRGASAADSGGLVEDADGSSGEHCGLSHEVHQVRMWPEYVERSPFKLDTEHNRPVVEGP